MFKAYKYRLLPTPEQREHLDGAMRAGRMVYNLALETKIWAWRSGEINLSGFDLMRQLTELMNHEGAWLRQYNRESLESEITHLEKSYKSFFRGGGFSKFKSRHGRQSIEYRRGVSLGDGMARIPKLGWVSFIEHRPLAEGEVRTITVSKEPTGKYFISILVKDASGQPEKPPKTAQFAIGIDVGLKTFATLSDGTKVDNPKYLAEQLKKLRVEQRKLSRRFVKGAKEQSRSYFKQRLVVAKIHEKIKNKRTDFLQKFTTDLIRNNDTICVESLNVLGMQQNGSLAKSISDASWNEFVRMLKYKGEWYGKNIIEIGMFEPSSKTCSNCGFHHKELALSDRTWHCDNCGAHHDRDINAAINIKNIGLKAQPTTVKTGQKVESIGCEQDAAVA